MRSDNYISLKDNQVIRKHYENFSIAKFLPKKSKNAIIKTISKNYITAELKELGMKIVLKKTDLLV